MTDHNITYANNTGADLTGFHAYFVEAAITGVLPEELADLFSLTLLVGFNEDKSNRLIINAA